MRLIDTSIWIEFFRSKGDPTTKLTVANLFQANQAAFTCPVYYELVLGAFANEIPKLKSGLGFASRIPLEIRHWDKAVEAARLLKQSGTTVPQSDLLIAVVANWENLPVLTADQHFLTIQKEALTNLKVQMLR